MDSKELFAVPWSRRVGLRIECGCTRHTLADDSAPLNEVDPDRVVRTKERLPLERRRRLSLRRQK